MQPAHVMLIGVLLRVAIYVPYVLGIVYLVQLGVTDHRLAIIMGVAAPSMAALEAAIRRFESNQSAKDGEGRPVRGSDGKYQRRGD